MFSFQEQGSGCRALREGRSAVKRGGGRREWDEESGGVKDAGC